MSSTDIDGSPIVILSKDEAEEVLQACAVVETITGTYRYRPLCTKIKRALGAINEPNQ